MLFYFGCWFYGCCFVGIAGLLVCLLCGLGVFVYCLIAAADEWLVVDAWVVCISCFIVCLPVGSFGWLFWFDCCACFNVCLIVL